MVAVLTKTLRSQSSQKDYDNGSNPHKKILRPDPQKTTTMIALHAGSVTEIQRRHRQLREPLKYIFLLYQHHL